MSSNTQMDLDDLTVDKTNLYREENYTDLQAMTLRRMVPIKPDGSDDPDRDALLIGQTQIMTQMGALPVNVPLEAKTVAEAADEFPAKAKEAVHRMLDELKEAQRQAANRIVVPEGGAGGLGGLGGAPGGQGGGKIQL